MNQNQELKSLKRGLRALSLVNQLGSMTITELGRTLRLPRTTAERVLVTLNTEGFLDRDPDTKRYFLSLRVRGLANGYTEQSWISHVAAPLMFEATRRFGWPLCIAIPHGEYMIVRLTTDPETSLNLNPRHIGSEAPMAHSSSGLVHLAFVDEEERRVLLEMLRKSDDPFQAVARDHDRMELALSRILENGYGFGLDYGHERSIAVPIMMHGRIKAVLLMVFMARAMTNEVAAQKFAPQLQAMAAAIEKRAAADNADELDEPDSGARPYRSASVPPLTVDARAVLNA
jgi:IclR family transcriptional regulator, mhp operon transcriptional activator